jgi:ketosteroid isomerase-like protein
MTLDTRDLIEIHMLLALYGHTIDERHWSAIDQVFTDDIVYDATDFGLGVMRGIPAIVEAWKEPFEHPLAHHTTNIVITEDPDGTVRARAKHIGPHSDHTVYLTYHDVLRKTAHGWRIAERVARRRTPETIPAAH